MNNSHDALDQYPHGRGYGHDYMRGGEVLGGYGYSERPEYELTRGELMQGASRRDASDQESSGRARDTST